MKIIYRISENGFLKEKPNFINNQNCFKNAIENFTNSEFIVIGDNITNETKLFLEQYVDNIIETNIGHGAGTFNIGLDLALKMDENEIIYFLENDYLHRLGSEEVLIDIFNSSILFDYVTLYDHPDKYLNPYEGGNPFCVERSENTRVYLGKHCHWKSTNSTTMTFASKVKTLKEDKDILREWTKDTYPHDFYMFQDLIKKRRKLISPIPGFSTHGEVKNLSPLINWEKQL
jgi:hypothetical protein